jgi:uncharacterized protein (TIGR00369 family)
VTTDPGQIRDTGIQRRAHKHCVVCGQENTHGYRLDFHPSGDGEVVATFGCDRSLEGYPSVLHGGVISCLLDGAMTNCMFTHGYVAVTAEMRVRYFHPVATGVPATIRARITRSINPLHMVEAEFVQNQTVMASAEAKFMEHPSLEHGLGGMDPDDH